MNLFEALATIGQGVARSVASHQLRNDPKLRRKAAAKTEGCTPCAAAAYVENLQEAFSNNGQGQKKGKKRR